MMTETIAKPRAEDIGFEERWTAWVDRGLEHDRLSKKRGIVGIAVIAAVVVLGLLFIR
jgi:hypothetical protein